MWNQEKWDREAGSAPLLLKRISELEAKEARVRALIAEWERVERGGYCVVALLRCLRAALEGTP